MHVLVVPSWYPTTEAPLDGIYFVEQARCLQAHGMDVGVVYPEHQSLRRLAATTLGHKHFQTEWTTDHGIPTLRRYGWNVWWQVPPGLRCRIGSAVRLARKYVDRRGVPDVVHAHSARWAGAAAARVSDAFGVPYVLTEHFSGFQRGSILPWRRPLVDRGLRQASGLAAVSAGLKEALTGREGVVPQDVAVHPNPVRASFFTRPPKGRPSESPFRFVTVAGLNSRKNIGGLIDAFTRAFEASNGASLTIVGDGPRRAALEARARRLGVEDQVAFRGQQGRLGVREALWGAHAFVLPSRHETFGVALVEAMATGLPVALAEALCTIRNRWGAYDAECIRAHAVTRYGPAPFVRRTQSFYRRARAA